MEKAEDSDYLSPPSEGYLNFFMILSGLPELYFDSVFLFLFIYLFKFISLIGNFHLEKQVVHIFCYRII